MLDGRLTWHQFENPTEHFQSHISTAIRIWQSSRLMFLEFQNISVRNVVSRQLQLSPDRAYWFVNKCQRCDSSETFCAARQKLFLLTDCGATFCCLDTFPIDVPTDGGSGDRFTLQGLRECACLESLSKLTFLTFVFLTWRPAHLTLAGESSKAYSKTQ